MPRERHGAHTFVPRFQRNSRRRSAADGPRPLLQIRSRHSQDRHARQGRGRREEGRIPVFSGTGRTEFDAGTPDSVLHGRGRKGVAYGMPAPRGAVHVRRPLAGRGHCLRAVGLGADALGSLPGRLQLPPRRHRDARVEELRPARDTGRSPRSGHFAARRLQPLRRHCGGDSPGAVPGSEDTFRRLRPLCRRHRGARGPAQPGRHRMRRIGSAHETRYSAALRP